MRKGGTLARGRTEGPALGVGAQAALGFAGKIHLKLCQGKRAEGSREVRRSSISLVLVSTALSFFSGDTFLEMTFSGSLCACRISSVIYLKGFHYF